MRFSVLFLSGLLMALGTAFAADTPAPKGLWLLTDYPALSVRSGETAIIKMKVQNSAMLPERLSLSVNGLPSGWSSTIFGGGQPIEAVMPAPNATAEIELRLDVPADAPQATHDLTVEARGQTSNLTLPLQVSVGKVLPSKLELKPKLTSLRGSASSDFEYEFTLKNESGRSLVVSLVAVTPQNFYPSFQEAYGNQELTSVPIDSGATKDLKFKVELPSNTNAGKYDIGVRAVAPDASVEMPLALEVTGKAELRVGGKEGRVSADAQAGEASQIEIEVANDGTAAANDVQIKADPPEGWKVDFDNKSLGNIEPGNAVTVTASVTPTEKAIAGDYMVKVEAEAGDESKEVDFRIAVTTSTLWGVIGIGIIAIALLVLVGAVGRFGRR